MTNDKLSVIECFLSSTLTGLHRQYAAALVVEVRRLRTAIASHREQDRHHLYTPYWHDLELWAVLDEPEPSS